MTYVPSHFRQDDADQIAAFLASHPFATVIVNLDGELWPTPMPLIYQSTEGSHGQFIGHVARNNTMWRASADSEVLVIFQGPNTYITPNWYATKSETHEVVPTWNYASVHAWGRMTVHHDVKFKRKAVGLLTKIHESSNPNPWKMADAPGEFIADQLTHIVGIRIDITRIKAKWKLNQNRSEADRAGVIAGLGERSTGDDSAIRELMLQETVES